MGPIKPDFLVLREVLNGCGSTLGFQETVWLQKPMFIFKQVVLIFTNLFFLPLFKVI